MVHVDERDEMGYCSKRLEKKMVEAHAMVENFLLRYFEHFS